MMLSVTDSHHRGGDDDDDDDDHHYHRLYVLDEKYWHLFPSFASAANNENQQQAKINESPADRRKKRSKNGSSEERKKKKMKMKKMKWRGYPFIAIEDDHIHAFAFGSPSVCHTGLSCDLVFISIHKHLGSPTSATDSGNGVLQIYALVLRSYTAHKLHCSTLGQHEMLEEVSKERVEIELPDSWKQEKCHGDESTERCNMVSDTVPLWAIDLMDATAEHVAVFCKHDMLIYLWNYSITPAMVQWKLVEKFPIFGTVSSLRLTDSHIIVGKKSSVQVFNWRNHLSLSGNMDKKEENEGSEYAGRCVFLPREQPDTAASIPSANVTLPATSLIKLDSSPSVLTSDSQSVMNRPMIPATLIRAPDSERVIDIRAYTNSKFIMMTSSGALYLLSCVMPFSSLDVLVRIELQSVDAALPSQRVTALDTMSARMDPIVPSGGGVTAVVVDKTTIALFKAGDLFDKLLHRSETG